MILTPFLMVFLIPLVITISIWNIIFFILIFDLFSIFNFKIKDPISVEIGSVKNLFWPQSFPPKDFWKNNYKAGFLAYPVRCLLSNGAHSLVRKSLPIPINRNSDFFQEYAVYSGGDRFRISRNSLFSLQLNYADSLT